MTDRGTVELPKDVERLLGGWPVPEKSESFWESSEAAVLARIAAKPKEKTEDALLAAPVLEASDEAGQGPVSAPRLVPTAAERTNPARSSRPELKSAPPPVEDEDEHSLADFARSVASRKPQSSSPDLSARELLLSATQARESSPVLASPPPNAEALAAVGHLSLQARAPVQARPPVQAQPPVQVQAAPNLAPAGRSGGRTGGIVIGLLAAAAAFALWFFLQNNEQEPVAALQSPAHSIESLEQRAAERAPAAASPEAAPEPMARRANEDLANLDSAKVAAKSASSENTGDTKGGLGRLAMKDNLNRQAPGGGGLEKKVAMAPQAIELAENESAKPSAAGAVQKEEAAPPQATNAPAEPPPPAAPIAAAPAPAKMKPADSASGGPGDLPEKPSTGAVQAAVASRLGAARSCVSGQNGPSTASITWSSDGAVQSVSVSGPAAGSPAAACIKSALGAARVKPFSRTTYSVPLTIRPLD